MSSTPAISGTAGNEKEKSQRHHRTLDGNCCQPRCCHSYPPENRVFSHGQGYDLVERPGIRDGETMPLATGMNVAIHPVVLSDPIYTFACNNVGP